MDKPRYRVKAPTLLFGVGVPEDAKAGDLVVGNRGAAALVRLDERLRVLYLEYVGNYMNGARPNPGLRVYDLR